MAAEAITSRFGARSTALDVITDRDLRGRNAIVTGGASGIGVETVRALALVGARVVLAARNRAQADDVAASLLRESGDGIANSGGAIEVAALDLASLRSVRAFADGYLASGRPLHILINNAGVMATPQSYTEDGFELQFGTNHLGHFALATGLLPALRTAGAARVVSLTSIGHRRSDVFYDDINFRERPYDPWTAYGQSKSANALFAVGLTQRSASDGINSNAVMPGGILTGLQKHMTREEQIAMGWFDEHGTPNARFKNTAQGAATSVWAAVAPELEGVGGLYLEDCKVAKPWTQDQPLSGYLPYALDPANAERLWSVSASLIAEH